uniref:Protein phosphatase 1 regulatory subunit n=1 Tax=Latimeria chalumnae TaxID=7897 RepID=H3BEC2_LATCH
QACIDENLDMVEFLVEHGANINQPDNEGWTPLHAAASCGFVEISSYLIKHGASVAAVNSEGELPLDVAQESAMERLLQAEIKKQGIDIEAARREEEQVMLRDARQWLNQGKGGDYARHPKTGATPLHVAAAKGYLEVMKLLLQAGLDVNTSDVDGWMPLHAAAHWGQEEACRLLVESLCNMEAVNKVGQTPFDVADDNLESVLEELKKKQNDLHSAIKEKCAALVVQSPCSIRSSISRMSSKEKISLHDKERKTLETLTLEPVALERVNDEEEEGKKDESSSSSSEEEEPSESESDSEKAKTREIINNLNNKLNSPAVSSGSVTTTPASPTKKFGGSMSKPATKEEEKKDQAPASWRTSLRKTGSYAALSSGNAPQEDLKGKDSGIVRSASSPRLSSTETEDKDNDGKETRLARVPPTPTRRLFSNQDNSQRASGDSSYVPSSLNRSSSYTRRVSDADSGKKDLGDAVSSDASGLGYQRSSSFGRRALDSVPTSTSGTIAAGTGTSSFPSQQTAATTTSGSYTGRLTLFKIKKQNKVKIWVSPPPPKKKSYLSRGQPEESLKEKESSSTVTSLRTTSTTNTETKERRRSYLTPVRDEEAEAQRKARSRHARQSRRSTQGVTLTDLQEAEKTIKSQQEGKQVESKEQEKKKEEEKEKTDENKDILSKYRSSKTNEDGYKSYKCSASMSPQDKKTASFSTYLCGLGHSTQLLSNQSRLYLTLGYSRISINLSQLEKSKEEEKDSDDKGNRNKLGIRDRRRPRGKRRSTGVPCLTRDSDENEEGSEEEDEIAEGSEQNATETQSDFLELWTTGMLSIGSASLYNLACKSSMDQSYMVPEKPRSDKPETEGGKKDYKKLYEQLTRENGRLREQLQETQKLIGQTKGELEKASQRQERFVDRSALLETEKKEQRLLERRISELEEELKVLADLKADNQRLKDENGALIRVISKLSK